MSATATPTTESRFWGWPGWRHLGLTLALGAGLNLWWVLTYGGADYVARLHSYRVRLHLDAELRVPFVSATVLGYLSVYPLLWTAPFVLRRRRELVAYALALASTTFVAGICFLLLPADSCFPTPQEMGPWEDLVRFAKEVALEHNWAPSLHVGLCVVCVLLYARRAPRWGAGLLWAWSVVVAVSTVLLHQHYLIDVLTGYLLAWATVRLVYDRLTQGTPPASPSSCPGRSA
jgi:membrane-associated phospholipid phosphatase